MGLSTGMQLGPYEIVSLIGAGGMGEVYKARDTRLNRTVAIKTLAQEVSNDFELKKRFEREAQAVAALNHPHICVLHDIGCQDGVDYIVMEYLNGETLAARLEKGPLPLDQGLRLAIEIADALDKAHRASVTHRDLKPGNIMLTKSGAKLLDFGLAKLREAGPTAVAGLSTLPTKASGLTAQGTILGTLQYMAPEQLEGQEADARADIFSFGAVLYEILTGKKAFEGKSQASLIAAILEREPPPASSLQPATPPLLDHLVRGCMAKDPAERWQTAHDVVKQLHWIATLGAAASPAAAGKSVQGSRLWIAIAMLSALTITASLSYLLGFRSVPDAQPMRFTVAMPDQIRLASMVTDAGAGASARTISPNGKRLLFSGIDVPTGKMQLYVRPTDSTEAMPLPGTEGALLPFWSPNSDAVAFFARGKLQRVALNGGEPQVICDAPHGWGGAWNHDDVIIAGLKNSAGLFRVSAGGGDPTPLTTPAASEYHAYPQFLPDGNHFLYYSVARRVEDNAVYVSSLDSKGQKLLFKGMTTMAGYAQPGYLLFVRDGALMIQPFDARRLESTGQPFRLADHISAKEYGSGGWGLAAFSASENGVIAYRTASRSAPDRFVWIGRDGKEIGPVLPPGYYCDPAVSPDGRRLAFARKESATGTFDISILELASGKETKLTIDPADDRGPVWSPDSSAIMFSSSRKTGPGLYRKNANGVGTEELIYPIKELFLPYQWPSNGSFIYFQGDHPGDLSILSLSDRKSTALGLNPTTSGFGASDGVLSPDSRWLAYASNVTGQTQIYVTTYPPSSTRLTVSTSGGSDTRWSKNGKELFYVSLATGELMSVDVTPGNPPGFGPPRRVYAGPLDYVTIHSFDLTPDETRFLVHIPDSGSDITVLLNWPSLLKK